MLQLLFVMAMFGGLAAGATIVWQKKQAELQTAIKRAEAAEAIAAQNPLDDLQKKPEEPKEELPEEPKEELPELPVAVRPPFVEGEEGSSKLVVALNQRLRATYKKELSLNERQEALRLIFADIHSEQLEMNKLRQEVGSELNQSSRSVRDAMRQIQSERDRLRQEVETLRSTPATNVTPEPTDIPEKDSATNTDDEPEAGRRLGVFYDKMPADVLADLLRQLTKEGRGKVAVQILEAMNDRQAARVLAILSVADSKIADQLSEQRVRR